VTGCKTVGITLDIQAKARAQQARVKTATELPIEGPLSLINSQIKAPQKRDPEAPDGRRNNGGTPPVRRPGDTQRYSAGARRQIGRETASRKAEGATE
jgi:hypothetical protein